MAATTKSSSGSLRTYLVTRLLLVIPMVWVLVTLVFFVMRVIGDPIESAFGGRLPADQIAIRRHNAGLDRPLLSQYWDYLVGVLHGDFGRTLTDNQRVSSVIITKGAATLELTFWALIVALAVGIPLGRVAARYRDRPPDVVLRLFAVLAYATPVFFLGLLLKLLFAIKLGWLPASGRASTDVEIAIQNVSPKTNIYLIDAILYGDPSYVIDVIKHAILPAITLGLFDRWGLPPAGPSEPVADNAIGLCRGGPGSGRAGATGHAHTRFPERDDPGRHRPGTADCRTSRRRRTH